MLLICVYTVVYALKVIRVFLLYLLLKVLCESIDHMTLDTTSNILLRTLNGIKSAPPHTHTWRDCLVPFKWFFFHVHTKMKSPSGTFPRIYPSNQVVPWCTSCLDVFTLWKNHWSVYHTESMLLNCSVWCCHPVTCYKYRFLSRMSKAEWGTGPFSF